MFAHSVGGGTFQFSDRIVMPFRLLGATPAAIPARIGVPLNTPGYRIGVDLTIAAGTSFRLEADYERMAGAEDHSDSARLRLSYRF